MDAQTFARAFWRDVVRQDATALTAYFLPEAQIRWHCTNERFSVTEYVRANCEYPGDWAGEVERVECAGGVLITATRVWLCPSKRRRGDDCSRAGGKERYGARR